MFFNVSGKGGIAQYNYFLCSALTNQGMHIDFVTTTKNEVDFSMAVAVFRPILFSHYLFNNRLIKGILYMLSLIRFYLCVIKGKPDIIHWHELKIYSLEYILLKYFKSRKIKLVLSAHDVLNQENQAVTPFLFKLYHLFDGIIVHTKDSQKLIHEYFQIKTEKIYVIPLGEYSGAVQDGLVKKNDARKILGIQSDRKIMLFFGYIRKYKGLELLLQAMPSVLKSVPEAILIIAGEPKEDFKRYETLINRLNISSSVFLYLRYIPLEEISVYFSAADIVVLPYLNIYQSAVLHLAFAFKRPVIVTPVGGLPEVVEDGKNGFVLRDHEPATLADSLIHAFVDMNRLQEMGEYAYWHSQNNLSWDSIAVQTIDLYKSLMIEKN